MSRGRQFHLGEVVPQWQLLLEALVDQDDGAVVADVPDAAPDSLMLASLC